MVGPWALLSLALVAMLRPGLVNSVATEPSGIRIDRNEGGYTGIVFEIKDHVPEEHCAEIIQNLRVRRPNLFILRQMAA